MSEDGHLPPEIWCVRRGPRALRRGAARCRRSWSAPGRRAACRTCCSCSSTRPSTRAAGAREPGELPMGEEWYRAQGIDVVRDRPRRARHLPRPGPARRLPDHEPQAVPRRRARSTSAAWRRRSSPRSPTSASTAGPIEGLTGVWTREPRKIASIGVHVSRGVTTHGFAINVNNDLQPFEWIVPCGIENCRMTSVARELRRAVRHGPLHGHRRAASSASRTARLPRAAMDELIGRRGGRVRPSACTSPARGRSRAAPRSPTKASSRFARASRRG